MTLQETPSGRVPPEFTGGLEAHALVFRKKQYIGYVDRYCYFIPKGHSDPPISQVLFDVIIFSCLKYMALLLSVLLLITLIWCRVKKPVQGMNQLAKYNPGGKAT
jgi:hypothetical protein